MIGAKGCMGRYFTGRIVCRVRLGLALFALLSAAVATLLASPLALPLILIASALILLDSVALSADVRVLAASVAATVREADAPPLPDLKFEVAEGAWGELCHALNDMRQQRRAEQRLRHLLPALPVTSAARLADLSLAHDGLPCDVVVLALVHPGGPDDRIAQLCDTAYAALHQAQLHDALLSRWGEGVVLVFGVFSQQDALATLRGAHHAAQALSAAWSARSPDQRPRLILTSGQGRAVILPGLGLTVVGPPVAQAFALQRLAGGDLFVCTEAAYLGLRRLGVASSRPAVHLPASGDSPHAFAISLQMK